MPNADRIVDAAGGKPGKDEVTVLLTADNLLLTGWKAVRISRSSMKVEKLPFCCASLPLVVVRFCDS